jgi:hypothetical protein
MPAIYVHLSGRNLNKAILRASGVKGIETMEKEENLKVCPYCKRVYSGKVDFCEALFSRNTFRSPYKKNLFWGL